MKKNLFFLFVSSSVYRSLPAATYLVRISTGHGTAFKKLVVK